MARVKKYLDVDIISQIKRKVPNYQADYIFWKFAPECLSYDPVKGDFTELKAKSSDFPNISERIASQWLLDDDIQAAVTLLLQRKNTQQMHELHQKYYELSQTDHQALRALLELNKTLFKDDESALDKLLKGIPDDVESDIE